MSLWHSPHVADSVKKSDGIVPPTLVCADDGKNGFDGPPPSCSIEIGAVAGLTIRSAGDGCVRAYHAVAAGNARANANAALKAGANHAGLAIFARQAYGTS